MIVRLDGDSLYGLKESVKGILDIIWLGMRMEWRLVFIMGCYNLLNVDMYEYIIFQLLEYNGCRHCFIGVEERESGVL